MKKHNQKGFAVVAATLILLILAIVGFTGWYVMKVKTSTTSSYDSSANRAATQPQAQSKKVSTKTETTIQSQNTTSTNNTTTSSNSTSPTPAPKTQKTTTTTNNHNINHPTAANCNRQNFTVYASNTNGTNAYGPSGAGDAGQIHYTVKYGDPVTDVYCDSDSVGHVFRWDTGSSMSEFNFSDVSVTKPN